MCLQIDLRLPRHPDRRGREERNGYVLRRGRNGAYYNDNCLLLCHYCAVLRMAVLRICIVLRRH